MAAKPRIAQLGPMAGSESADRRLDEAYDVLKLWQAPDPAALLREHGAGIEVLVTNAVLGCRGAVMEAMPDLRAICCWSVGYDSLDLAAARRLGLQIGNTPNASTDCVADLAWGMLLACARGIGAGERLVRDGRWAGGAGLPLGIRVSGKKLGVLGLGRIGRAVAARAAGFSMEVRYHGRRRIPDAAWGFEANLAALAGWADFLVVAAAGGEATRGLVGAGVLRALGPRGILVNVARGSVVDEAAVQALLASGELGGAALDVFEHEPCVPEALARSDRAVVLPHIGSATLEAREAMVDELMHNIDTYFRTGRLATPVELA